MKLSENFSLQEFEYSPLALENNIINKADYQSIKNLRKLCENLLEPIRKKVDSQIIITSGFRCQQLNNLVNGSKDSQHMRGQAADFIIKYMMCETAYYMIKNSFPYDQLIYEKIGDKKWIHISFVSLMNNRNQSFINEKN